MSSTRLIGLCAELGGKVLVHGSPKQREVAAGETLDIARARLRDFLAEAAEVAAAHGVVYCIEPLSRNETLLVNTVAEAAEIVRAVDRRSLRTMIDCSAAGLSESVSVPELIDAWLPTGLIGHVQVNDPNRRAPGQGEMQFAPIFAALQAPRLQRHGRRRAVRLRSRRAGLCGVRCRLSARRARIARLRPSFVLPDKQIRQMATQRLGIIMHGVTGRMGMNQHLIRSICAIRAQGGTTLANGDKVMPDPILIGRNAEKIEALAKAHGIARWGTDLAAALANKDDTVFFDSGTTQMRPQLLADAIRAGKHVYCEKPIATNLNEAVEIARVAKASGLKHGAVQDKLFLPGLRKLDMLRRAGFFGRMLAARIDFGYWVFEGDLQPIQRPSWNYRAEDGGGMILDMMCHWRYVLDNLFGEVKSVSCLGATHIPKRWDEAGKPYPATADDAAYATCELVGHNGEPVIAQLTMSWATRVRRDDLVTFAVDGTDGSAVAGLSACRAQSRVATPRPVWNPDEKQTMNFFDQWQEIPDSQVYENGFKIQWEAFIRHVVENAPYKWTLEEGAKGVQLVEAALASWKERRWIDVPKLAV